MVMNRRLQQVIGFDEFNRPIFLAFGAEGDTDADTDDVDTDDTTDNDEDNEGEDNDTDPAALTEALKRERARNKRAGAALAKERKLRKAAEAKSASSDADKVKNAAEAAAEAKYKGVAVRKTAKAELLAAGADKETVDLLADKINPADVEMGDDGEFDLEDAIDELKEKYPKLFTDPADNGRAPRRPGGIGKKQQAAAGDARNMSEKLFDAARKSARYGG